MTWRELQAGERTNPTTGDQRIKAGPPPS